MVQILTLLKKWIIAFVHRKLSELSTRPIAWTFAIVWFVVLSLLYFVVAYGMGRGAWVTAFVVIWAFLTLLSIWLEPYWYYFVWLPLWYRIDSSAGSTRTIFQKLLFWVDWGDEANAVRRQIYFSIPRVLKKSDLPQNKEAWKEFFDEPDKYGETRWQKLSDAEQRYPMIARAIDVFERKGFLEKAKRVFAILLIDDRDLSFKYKKDKKKGKYIDVKLQTKLHCGLAIYSNLGKAWLNYQTRKKFASKVLSDKANWVHSWLLNPGMVTTDYPANPAINLRWASGGGISLVRIINKEKPVQDPLEQVWVALFFRDIPPIGWNVGNGGSEDRKELIEIEEELCYREFVEEYMVIEEGHAPGSSCDMAIFELHNGSAKKKTSEEFVYKHNEYRKRVDGLFFQLGKTKIPFELVKGANTSIWVWPSQKEDEAGKNYHLLFSLNPFEQGIETIGIYFWTLPEGYTILDGEFHLGRKVLIRRPVGLFNLKWLYQYWEANKHSLGTLFDVSVYGGANETLQKKFAECKILEEVPEGKFKLMAKDFELRKKRLQRLLKYNRVVFNHPLPEREQESLKQKDRNLYQKALQVIEQINCKGIESLQMWKLTQSLYSSQCAHEMLTPELAAFWLYRRYLKDIPYAREMKPVIDSWEDVWFEIELSATWLCDYGHLIERLLQEQEKGKEPALTGPDTLPLRSLCPVTWKSLEMIFQSKEIMENIKILAERGVA